MGYFSKGECHGSIEAAKGATCASYPISTADGTVLSCAGISASGVAIRSNGGTATEVALAFPTCDEDGQVSDLTEFWGLALVALVGVWCLRQFVLKLVTPQ